MNPKRIEQTLEEQKMLDALYERKSKVDYSFSYTSSAYETSLPQLGTIEADAAGRFGRWNKEKFRAEKLALLCSQLPSVQDIIDVGGGQFTCS